MDTLGLSVKPKTVFVDWYGTLSPSLFWEQLLEKRHIHHKAYVPIKSVLFSTMKPKLEIWMRGGFTAEDIVGELAVRTSLDRDIIWNTLVESCQQMKFVSDEIPSLVREVQELGIPVVIATDNMDTFTRWTVPYMMLMAIFTGILNSSDLKARKLDFWNGESLFFGQYLKERDLKPTDCLLFDDSADKDGRIEGYGIKYVHLTSHTGLVPALKQFIVEVKSL